MIFCCYFLALATTSVAKCQKMLQQLTHTERSPEKSESVQANTKKKTK